MGNVLIGVQFAEVYSPCCCTYMVSKLIEIIDELKPLKTMKGYKTHLSIVTTEVKYCRLILHSNGHYIHHLVRYGALIVGQRDTREKEVTVHCLKCVL